MFVYQLRNPTSFCHSIHLSLGCSRDLATADRWLFSRHCWGYFLMLYLLLFTYLYSKFIFQYFWRHICLVLFLCLYLRRLHNILYINICMNSSRKRTHFGKKKIYNVFHETEDQTITINQTIIQKSRTGKLIPEWMTEMGDRIKGDYRRWGQC